MFLSVDDLHMLTGKKRYRAQVRVLRMRSWGCGVVGSWGLGVMGSWGRGVLGSWGRGVMGLLGREVVCVFWMCKKKNKLSLAG